MKIRPSCQDEGRSSPSGGTSGVESKGARGSGQRAEFLKQESTPSQGTQEHCGLRASHKSSPEEVTSRLRHEDEMKLQQSPLHKEQRLGREAKGIKEQWLLQSPQSSSENMNRARSIRPGFPESDLELLSGKQGVTEDLSLR